MEFRHAVSVCRSAAAATRPSLASTRPSPSSILLVQRQPFTTNNNKQQLEAAAAAPRPQSPPPAVNPNSSLFRVAQLQASLNKNPSAMPPRPPPIRKSNMLDDGGQRKRTPSWATPHNNAGTLFRNTRLTGRAPTGGSSAPGGSGSLFNLPTQISSDMERATTSTTTTNTSPSLSTWNEEEFLPKHYDVAEPELRLRPSTGRTVHVRGNVDLARGFRLLQRAVTQNKIKRDERMARAYERPGLKRKRLKSERWAARFKFAFKSTIARAMELKGQGW
ncbi:hypothetical protein C8A01DRAFT_20698 [Parachaetomium inaequale]|uniref:Ribosomal protein S21 n=1 Tax=Parachaetomium inaequale TaxID=2588326 RepID=A0AAN6SKX7_9PEZI|nr:hypothetical protein C8A01DRAFT_20698 [Parachaetomium inaequale]